MIRSTPSGNIVTFPDESPNLIRLLIQYFYGADYEPYILANTELDSDLEAEREASTAYEYTGEIITHVQMFTLGCKYSVDGLQELVVEKFHQACQRFWYTDDFEKVAEAVVLREHEKLESLRMAIVDTVAKHPELWKKMWARTLFEKAEGFETEVLKRRIKKYMYLEQG
tara:strand:+ start:565 stop:1071 length:507 start_codon:yes stop_codon:yes gene_type:complete